MAAAPPPPVSTILGHTVFPPAFLPLTTTTFTAQTSIYPRTMPHADAANIPEHVRSKAELWDLIYTRLEALLEGERNWVTNCANAASLVFTALLSSSEFFGTRDMAVNWCGFYLDESLFPAPRWPTRHPSSRPTDSDASTERLLLGPFCGKPACQFINVTPGNSRGVCADAFIQQVSVLVDDVNAYPGHIACDSETNSELVCPLLVPRHDKPDEAIAVGVLDMDCVGMKGFNEDDRLGAEKIAKLIADSCDW